MARVTQGLTNLRKTGQTSFGAVTPVPLTQLVAGHTSTTFTTSSEGGQVVGSSWDLSAIDGEAGHVLVVDDGTNDTYMGITYSVDDATDTIKVHQWVPMAGGIPNPKAAGQVPTDGDTATIHRIAGASRITIKAASANTGTVYVGLDGTARATDYPLTGGESLTLEAEEGKFLDITRIYLLSSTGTQTVSWAVRGAVSGEVAVTINLSGPFTYIRRAITDGDTTPDVSGGTCFYTANTGATTITDFDGISSPAFIMLEFGDGNTTVQSNGNIKLQFGQDFTGAQYDMMILTYNGTLWLELSRSANSA